jgi:hypothetical protein
MYCHGDVAESTAASTENRLPPSNSNRRASAFSGLVLHGRPTSETSAVVNAFGTFVTRGDQAVFLWRQGGQGRFIILPTD